MVLNTENRHCRKTLVTNFIFQCENDVISDFRKKIKLYANVKKKGGMSSNCHIQLLTNVAIVIKKICKLLYNCIPCSLSYMLYHRIPCSLSYMLYYRILCSLSYMLYYRILCSLSYMLYYRIPCSLSYMLY